MNNFIKDNKKEKTAFVALTVNKLLRGEKISDYEIKEALLLSFKKEVFSYQIFLGELLSLVAFTKKCNLIAGVIRGGLSLDNFSFCKENNHYFSICGSGKDDFKTFNVSSVVSMLACAYGIRITKIGAPGTSNSFGSENFFNILKNKKDSLINFEEKQKQKKFLYFSVRDIVPNLFNAYDGSFYNINAFSFGLMGIITASYSDGFVYGFSNPDIKICSSIFKSFGIKNVLSLSGKIHKSSYCDEVSIFDETKFSYVDKLGKIKNFQTNPNFFNMRYDFSKDGYILRAWEKEEFEKKLYNIFRNNIPPVLNDFLSVNLAPLLFVSGKTKNLKDGFLESKKFISSKKASIFWKK